MQDCSSGTNLNSISVFFNALIFRTSRLLAPRPQLWPGMKPGQKLLILQVELLLEFIWMLTMGNEFLQIIFCIASKIKSTRIKNLATDSLSKPVRNLCLIFSSKIYIYLNFLQRLLQGQSSCPYISFVKKSSCLKYIDKN